MAHVLRMYLWKEYRDQRAALGWLGAVFVSLAILAAFLLPRWVVGDRGFAAGCGGLALLVFLFTVGPDFLSRERSEGRVRFLERMPSGLRTAFVAKLALFLACAVFVTGVGIALAFAVHLARIGPAGFEWAWYQRQRMMLGVLVPLAIIAIPPLWTFAASAWVPRGALGAPAALLVLAFLGWPLWLVYSSDALLAPAGGEVLLYGVLVLIAAPVAGWFAFTAGNRYGGGRARAAARSLLVAAIVLAPAWAWTGWRFAEMQVVHPWPEHACVLSGWVDDGGRYAYVTVALEGILPWHEEGYHAVVIDLETGAWRSEGTGAWQPTDRGWSALPWNLPLPLSEVWLAPEDHESEGGWYDARTAQPLVAAPSPAVLAALPELVRKGIGTKGERWRGAGLGFYRDRKADDAYYDPFRERLFLEGNLFPDAEPPSHLSVAVRPGDWLVLRGLADGGRYLLDPDTGVRRPVPALTEDVRIGPLLPDGSLLVVEAGEVHRFDPESGSREGVALVGDLPGPVEGFYGFGGASIDSGGGVVLCCGEDWVPARYDPDASILRLGPAGTPGSVWLTTFLDDGSAISIRDDQRIGRVFFDGRDTEVLFPRPSE